MTLPLRLICLRSTETSLSWYCDRQKLFLTKDLGGANSLFLTGQSGAKTFFQVKNGFAPAWGYNTFCSGPNGEVGRPTTNTSTTARGVTRDAGGFRRADITRILIPIDSQTEPFFFAEGILAWPLGQSLTSATYKRLSS